MAFQTRRMWGGLCLVAAAALVAPTNGAWAAPRDTPSSSAALADRLDPLAKGERKAAKITANKGTAGNVEVALQSGGRQAQVSGSTVVEGDGTDFVVRGLDDGAQILAVARDADSLTQHYTFTGRYLELLDSGAVVVRASDSTSEPLAYIEPAWAKDKTGARLPSSYTVEGSTLIQTTTASTRTVFPVVADPRVRSTWYGWSVDFTKYETGRMSKSTASCSAVAGLVALGSGGVAIVAAAISAACGALTVFADTAVEAGKCVSVKVLHGGLGVVPWMPKCYK